MPFGYDECASASAFYSYVGNDPTDKTDPTGLFYDSMDPNRDFSSTLGKAQMQAAQEHPVLMGTIAVAVGIAATGGTAALGGGEVLTAIGARIAAASPSTAVAIPTISNALTEGNPASVGGRFSQAQKAEIYSQNMAKNGGELRSDLSGALLVPSEKSVKGVTPPQNAATVDHWIPRSKGGESSLPNAAVAGRGENIQKSNNMPTGPCPGGYTSCKK